MFKALIDTCVWLDLAKDRRQAPLLDLIEEMIRLEMLVLIVPRIVLEEFKNNKVRVAQESSKSLSAHFRLVKEAVNKVGGEKEKLDSVLAYLDDVNYKIPLIGAEAANTLDRVQQLMERSEIIEASKSALLKAADRAIAKTAPFHRNKNSMADAIIIETYAQALLQKPTKGTRFAFVTHNKSDFSAEQGNQKDPHPDLVDLFSPIKSLYFINLRDALRRIDPKQQLDYMLELSWTDEPRGRTEISEAAHLLWNQVWYDRHQHLRAIEEQEAAKSGREAVIAGQEAAKRVEEEFGLENLGPWTDFEWGMINGKLSALNWVMGEEWDMLDT
ncbi:hypothetical protein SAMN05421819_3509 [Bryocella elongata]|uniref:DUF4935 domain-containing protein n=2 Tax=Bryocella elongata TaxID=863522 RepID=A0A1H6B4T3_9BACT|nr:hypothetical protein SAMN05421819_3509 [Bryocella elongata]